MKLPLIILIVTLMAYSGATPSILAMLSNGMTRFVGLFGRDTFGTVVHQS